MTAHATTDRCTAMVKEPPHYTHKHSCSRLSKEQRLAKPLCTQHAHKFDEWEMKGRKPGRGRVMAMLHWQWFKP